MLRLAIRRSGGGAADCVDEGRLKSAPRLEKRRPGDGAPPIIDNARSDDRLPCHSRLDRMKIR